ncbi:MAG: ABC transporter permease [Xanthomonadaceae bacterium]|nr:ABC transporter permease [Xanthomonadaceae bacterium]
MSAPSAAPYVGHRTMTRKRMLRAYGKELKYECLRMLRTPAFAIPTLLFPTLFYLLIGFIFGAFKAADPNVQLYFFLGFATMGAMTPGMFSFGVGLASERERGLHRLKRALPMPPGAALLGKIALCVVSVTAAVTLLAASGIAFGTVPMTFARFASVMPVLAVGAIPFCALGLMIGSMTGGRSAPAIVNVLYMLMLYLSGLFIPLPDSIEKIVVISPAFYLHQLTLASAGAHSTLIGGALTHVAVLVAMTLLFTVLAARRFVRED